MKSLPNLIQVAALAALMCCASACSQAWRDDRRAATYADRIENSEAVSAEEYSEMVTFYCRALDRSLDKLKPLHDAHAAAVASGDTAMIAKTERQLTVETESVARDTKNVSRLGSQLFNHLGALPDTTRHRLLSYLSGIYDRYSNSK
ncbi:MAG: hypothetical protein HDR45_02495 [Bacteroides sp.]|nr:hypothetical protein [Bacteroidales bacterium]MBD5325578.1 hypothetical protein [Bacteroides sp.]MBD5425051.1 hypothetical protein [Bacteroides sp.]MDE6223088.1 hypothetical protein [Muribaculaceae bacterium]